MHDELERPAESSAPRARGASDATRMTLLDVAGAIGAAEKATGSRIIDVASSEDFARTFAEAVSTADQKNERLALVGPAVRFASAREAMRRAADARIGLVVHAIAGHGAEDLAALSDVGWGVLCASGPEDAFDLSLIARRAAEDSGVPFVVVHGLGDADHPAGRAVAMVGIPENDALVSFVGPAAQARVKDVRRLSVGDRAFAERVPFALGAAFREYGDVSGRRRDVLDKVPMGESPLMLVGMGPVGDALCAAIPSLRARGYDVGAINITSLRPFPGQRLVKALSRALAITVLEPTDEPLAHGSLLARDVKSAFTDALTWMPGFPGIGRIPKLFVGATGVAFDIADLAGVCDNMLADERGRRVFSFVDVEQSLPRARLAERADAAPREIAIRFVLDDGASAEAILEAVGAALASGAGLRTQGIVTVARPGGATLLDIVANRDGARGGMARRALRLVVATERGATTAGAVVSLEDNAVLAVMGTDPTNALPEAARTIVRERRARVLPLPTDVSTDANVALAVTGAGAALALAHRLLDVPLDGGAVGRVVCESCPSAADREATARRAQQVFEWTRDFFGARAWDDGKPVGVA